MLSQIDSSKHTHVSRKITPYMADGVTATVPNGSHISPCSLSFISHAHISLNNKESYSHLTGLIHVSHWD